MCMGRRGVNNTIAFQFDAEKDTSYRPPQRILRVGRFCVG